MLVFLGGACAGSPRTTNQPSVNTPAGPSAPTTPTDASATASAHGTGATASPSASAIEQVLVLPGPNPGSVVTVRIVDQSGSLSKARQATRSEIQRVAIIPDTIAVVGLPGDDRSLYARWTSSICEGETTVQIDAAIRSIEVQQPPRKQCDAVGTFVDLVLTFSTPIAGDLVTADLVETG
jgi:hypothetical protein